MIHLKNYKIPFLILIFAFSLRIISLNFPFGDYDEGIYTATLRSLDNGFPLLEKTYSSQFPLFIYISKLFYNIYPSLLSLRLFPVISSLIIILVSYILLVKYIGRVSAVFVSVYLSVNSIFLLTSRTFQADIPWTAFTILCFFFLLRFDEKRKNVDLILSSIFFAVSILIKVNLIFVPVLVFYLVFLYKDFRNLAWKYVAEYILIVLAVFLMVVPLGDFGILYNQAVHIRLQSIGIYSSNIFGGVRNILINHEAPVIFLDLITIVLILKKKELKRGKIFEYINKNRFISLVFTWLLSTSIIFLFYNPLFIHHFVFFIVPSSMFASFGIEILIKNFRHEAIVKCFVYVLIFFAVVYSSQSTISDTDILFPKLNSYSLSLMKISKYIDNSSKKSDYIVSDDPLILYLANRNTPPELVDTSYTRIKTGNLTSDEVKKYINKYGVKEVIVLNRFNLLLKLQNYLDSKYSKIRIGEGYVFLIN